MCARVSFVSVCFVVLLSALVISTTNGHGIEALFNKLNFLEDKILDIEQATRVSEAKWKAHVEAKEEHWQAKVEEEKPGANARQANMQDKLDELERGVKANEILLRQQLEQGLQARVVDLQGRLDAMERQMQAMEKTLQDKLLRVMDRIMTDNMNQLKETLLGEVLKTKKNGVPIAGSSNITIRSAPDTSDDFVKPEIGPYSSAKQSEAPYGSCKEAPAHVSGRNLLQLNPDTRPFEVYCEQIRFGGGWIVFQRRFNGQLDFYRNWTEYSDGFGALDGEFWLGLDYLHQITSLRPHELLVEVKDFAGNYGYALYDEFEIGSEEDQYALKKLGKYQGTAGDSMSYNWGKKFSTADNNNGDYSEFGNCAADRRGGWWYVLCTRANLNGPYKKTSSSLASMYWHFSTHDRRCLAYSRMMIREI